MCLTAIHSRRLFQKGHTGCGDATHRIIDWSHGLVLGHEDWTEIRLLLPFTRSRSPSIFPVLPELAMVSILLGEGQTRFQFLTSPLVESLGNLVEEHRMTRIHPEGAGRVAGR
jgi:hypothetical protein